MKPLFAMLNLLFLSLLSSATEFNILAVGDTGKGNEGQYRVGAQMAKECQQIDCKFVMLLGDNFYNEGVTSPQDEQFKTKFELPYKDISVPFKIVLGNHDYGKWANSWKRGQYQIEYGKINPKWQLPANYYAFEYGDVLFLVLDTSKLFHDKDSDAQYEFVRYKLMYNTKKWVVVSSHHPYISNGRHGNAGLYDGVPFPPYSGSKIKKLFEKIICTHADLVLTGHDHNLQTLPGPEKCPKPIFVVSGTGASASEDLSPRNISFFEKAVLGFTSVHFRKDEIEVKHINVDGQLEHSLKITK